MSNTIVTTANDPRFGKNVSEYSQICSKCDRTFGPYFNETVLRDVIAAHRSATAISGTPHEV